LNVFFGIRGKVFGDVLECGSGGVVARLQPCILGIPIFVVRLGSGRDLVQYIVLAYDEYEKKHDANKISFVICSAPEIATITTWL
jgi:hypothetical protein